MDCFTHRDEDAFNRKLLVSDYFMFFFCIHIRALNAENQKCANECNILKYKFVILKYDMFDT